MTDNADTNFNVARLYDYTKFHIGLYSTLVAGLLAFVKFMNDKVSFSELFLVTAVLFSLAGACGGLICTTCTYVTSKDQVVSGDKPVSIWGRKFLTFKLKTLTNWEHAFFWIGIVWAFGSVVVSICCE